MIIFNYSIKRDSQLLRNWPNNYYNLIERYNHNDMNEFTVINRAKKLKINSKKEEYKEDLKKLGINVDDKNIKMENKFENKNSIQKNNENSLINPSIASNDSNIIIEAKKDDKNVSNLNNNTNKLLIKDNKTKIIDEDDDYDEETVDNSKNEGKKETFTNLLNENEEESIPKKNDQFIKKEEEIKRDNKFESSNISKKDNNNIENKKEEESKKREEKMDIMKDDRKFEVNDELKSLDKSFISNDSTSKKEEINSSLIKVVKWKLIRMKN